LVAKASRLRIKSERLRTVRIARTSAGKLALREASSSLGSGSVAGRKRKFAPSSPRFPDSQPCLASKKDGFSVLTA
jgi:hypothetical protein